MEDEVEAFVCDDCGQPFEEGETDCVNPSCPTGAFNLAMDRGDELYHAAVDREVEERWN